MGGLSDSLTHSLPLWRSYTERELVRRLCCTGNEVEDVLGAVAEPVDGDRPAAYAGGEQRWEDMMPRWGKVTPDIVATLVLRRCLDGFNILLPCGVLCMDRVCLLNILNGALYT